MSSTRATGIALAFVAALISGVAIFVNGHAVKHFGDATVYTTAKNAVAGVLLLALAAPLLGGPRSAMPGIRRHRLGLLAIAVIGGSVPFVLFFEGLSRAEATQAAFIQKTLVVWVVILAVPLLHERLGWPHFAAIALLVVGQAWLVGDAGTVVFRSGEAMILAATLLWAVEVIVAKKLLADLDSRLLGAARMALGTIVLLGWVVVSGRARRAPLPVRRPVELGPVDRIDPRRLRGDLVRGARQGAGGRCDSRARLRGGGHGLALTLGGRRHLRPRCRGPDHGGRDPDRRPGPQTRLAGTGMTAGPLLFARYAYAPNALGYCGADEPRTLLEYGDAQASDPRSRGARALPSKVPGRTCS